MNIALVRPPNLANTVRGVGFYTERLFEALVKLNADIELVDFSYLSSPYKKFDIVHFPYYDTFFLTLPFMIRKNSVVTVHDLTPLLFPAGFPRGFKGKLKWQIQKFSLRFSDALITVSRSSKNDIIRLVGFPKNKIFVTYEAPGADFRPLKDGDRLFAVKDKYQLPEEFILYVGDINYNKNLAGLLRAFAKLIGLKKYRGVNLVLAGRSFNSLEIPEAGEIKREAEALGIAEKVVSPGFVPPEDLAVFYNLAKVYVQPSLYEGFGLPVVEAMACGCPVVCGKNSSLPEVAGEAGVYADIKSPEDLCAKVVQVLSLSPEGYQSLSRNCLSQAGQFSWEKTALGTLAVYEKINNGA